VDLAQYNLNNCRVYAPFDGMVTDLTTSGSVRPYGIAGVHDDRCASMVGDRQLS
jgi:predicted heme/steroid binding protein